MPQVSQKQACLVQLAPISIGDKLIIPLCIIQVNLVYACVHIHVYTDTITEFDWLLDLIRGPWAEVTLESKGRNPQQSAVGLEVEDIQVD